MPFYPNNSRYALKALRHLNGRFFGGKQLAVEFCRDMNWTVAVCGT